MHHSFDQNNLKLTRKNSGVYLFVARFATLHNHHLAEFVLHSGEILFSFWESNASFFGTEKSGKNQMSRKPLSNLIVSSPAGTLSEHLYYW